MALGSSGTSGSRGTAGSTVGGDERRHLAVLFSDLSGSTQLGRSTDPEVLDEILAHVKRVVFPIIESYGGTVIQFHGDGVLSVFGYPKPEEHDIRRAVDAAIDVHAAIRSLDLRHLLPRGFELRMHSGIDAGLVLVRKGDEVLGRLTVVGDPPNSAAGLADHAGRDEIYASDAAVGSILPFFEATAVPPTSLKGIDVALATHRIDGRSGITRRIDASRRRGLTPLIGRSKALEALQGALATAREGRLGRALVVGDAGLGKTRTVEEFLNLAREDGAIVLSGYCERQGTVAPLWPFQQALRQALDLSTDSAADPSVAAIEARIEALGLADQAVELLGVLGLEPTPDPAQLATGETAPRAQGGAQGVAAFAALLTRIASSAPLVLFFDDWQWSDDTSRLAREALLAILAQQPLLWITATRPASTSVPAPNEVHIALDPFSGEESLEAIQALAPPGLDLEDIGALHARSGGNPLFLEELCRSLEASQDGAGPALPATLHGLIEERVRRLPPDEAKLLRAASVVGNVVDEGVLRALCDVEEDARALTALEEDDLLRPGAIEGTLRFKHGITREAVYVTIKLAERRRLHGEIARILEERHADNPAGRPHESLAYHYEGAEDYERACEHAEIAGDRAWAQAALDRTRLQFGDALAALDRLERNEENLRRWLSISQRRAFACVFNPAREQIEMLEEAGRIGRELEDWSAVGHALFWRGFIHYSLGNMAESLETYQEGLEVAERAKNAKLVAQLRANLGEGRAATCEYDEAITLLDESIETKRRLHAGKGKSRTPTGSAYALACKAFIAAERGEVADSARWFEEAQEAVRGTGHPVGESCRAFESIAQTLYGRFERALELGERVRNAGARMNGPYLFGRGSCDAAFSRFMLTGEPDALDELENATRWLDEKEIRLYISLSWGFLAEAMVRAERFEEAREYAEKVLERADAFDPISEGTACRALARIEQKHRPEDPARAEAWLDRALRAAEKRGSLRDRAITLATHAEILADRGDAEAARARLGIALPELERMDLTYYADEARRLSARLARD